MSRGWPLVRLGEVLLESRYGTSAPSTEYGAVPILGIAHVRDGRIIAGGLSRVNLTDAERVLVTLEVGDILVTRTNSPELVGRSGVVRNSTDAVFASYLVRLRVDTERISPYFLNYWLNSDGGVRQVQRIATRAIGQSNVNPTELKKAVQVPLPPLAEQILVVDKLRTWDTAIERAERIVSLKTERANWMRHTLFLKALSRGPHRRFDELFQADAEKTRGGETLLSVTQDRGVTPRAELMRRIVSSDASVAGYKRIRRGSFAVSLRSFEGGIEYSEHDGAISAAYTVLSPLRGVEPSFYRHFFKSEVFVKKYLAESVVGIRDGKQIDIAGMLLTRIPVPRLSEQRSISSALDEAVNEIQLEKQRLIALKTSRRWASHLLFRTGGASN